jgi:proline iminopeptidase
VTDDARESTNSPAREGTTKFTARDGVTLAVHTKGASTQGGTPVLCVPGGPGRASSYLEDLGGLTDTHPLHLLDNRGTGVSELPADRDSLRFPRLADDVEDVRRALGLPELDVLGHSAGCAVALTHAVRYPGSVRRLVLVTPSGHSFGWAADDVEAIRAARADEEWYADAAEATAALADASPRLRGELEKETRPFWYGRWDARTQEHAAGADTQMSLRASAGFWPGPDYDAAAAEASLRTIKVPVLIVVGERDGLTGVTVADKFAERLPRAETAVIAGGGHFPWVDEPDGFRGTVATFLARGLRS